VSLTPPLAPSSTLFPYTTLFRSLLSRFFPVPVAELKRDFEAGINPEEICAQSIHALLERGVKNVYISNLPMASAAEKLTRIGSRSEEHTSELQSPDHLVCRLLLE